MPRSRHALALALAALPAACVTPGTAETITGRWGGTHVGLELTAAGGRLEYDCAAGTIGPVRPDAGGRFAATGFHTPGSGGPDVEGQIPQRLPALYSGRVRGDRMTLNVRIPSTGVEIGPLTLRRGAEPIILRCL